MRRVGVQNMAIARGEHDLHVKERYGNRIRVEQVFFENVVEVRCCEYLGAVGSTAEKVLEDATE